MGARKDASARFGAAFNLANNTVSLLGIVLTTVSALAILTFVAVELAWGIANPYVPIFVFLILPAIFVAGLVLIPIGMVRRRRALRRTGASDEEIARYPRLDFNEPRLRRTAVIVFMLSAVNVVIIGTTSFMAVDYMDTVEFCGTVCHTVMQPEHTAYQESPHSRVKCVQCHIGPGASWFVRSKLDGLRQVWRTTWDTYERPIHTPLVTLRPARETCEACHWPAKHYGDKLRLIARYATDEANTGRYTAMLLKTGGGALDLGAHGGIHWWHIYADNRIRYADADGSREEILWVELVTPDGESYVYTPGGAGEIPPDLEQRARLMDCIDCHNRPTHLFRVPSEALDEVLLLYEELRVLPFYKRQALAAIEGEYPTHAEGLIAVRNAIVTYYREHHPDLSAALVERAAQQAATVYGRSVFPQMKTNWETHPNHIGHESFPGCFRCHSGDLTTADGERMISPDCETCHVFLVEDSPEPIDIGRLQLASAR
jgi:hypothetical protein